MDPQAAMMNDSVAGGGGGGDFQSAATAPFSLSEIWPFPINAAAAYGLGLAANVSALTRDHYCSSMSDPMFLDQRLNQNGGDGGGGGARKRREDDETAKGVSTSGNGLVLCTYDLFILVCFVISTVFIWNLLIRCFCLLPLDWLQLNYNICYVNQCF